MGSELEGRTIVVTGGSAGIGAAAARILGAEGAKVVITGRSPATHDVARETGADPYIVDYASLADVRRFAGELLETYPHIDALVNNAGAIIPERRVTEDGHEMTLQVNHLAGFLLTNLLRERLEESRAVVINTSSMMNRMGRLDLADLESENGYDPSRAYGTTKLMNILHAMEVDRRFRNVAAASFHPGGVATRFGREGRGLIRWIYESPLRHIFLISPEKGADTLIWLLRGTPGEDWQGGEYYDKRKPGKRNPQVDAANARRLWEASEALIGEA